MKIRQAIFLLPLFLLAGCASAGGSQSRDLDLKESVQRSRFSSMRILNGERIRNSFSNRAS